VFVALAAALSLSAPPASGQVAAERLLNSSKEPQNWLMYSGDYAGHRFSALDQINAANAATLVPKWAYQTMAGGKFEATPLVVDGNFVWHPDRTTASTHWMRARGGLSGSTSRRCRQISARAVGESTAGLQSSATRVFVATLDAHVIALDSKTGNVVWDATAAEHAKGYSFTPGSSSD